MERERKAGWPRKIKSAIEKGWHLSALGTAVFLGKPGLARREANALGLDEKGQREAEIKAHFNAADRAEIIDGDPERAGKHLQQAFKLVRQESHRGRRSE